MNRVLIIEDAPALQRLYNDSLTNNGYEVAVAANGSEGYEIYKRFNPSLVIYDVFRPTPEVFRTVNKIKKEPKNVSIILLTEHLNQDSDLIFGKVDTVLMKSGDLTKLEKLVNFYLQKPLQDRPSA